MLVDPQGCARLVLVRHPQLVEGLRTTALGQGDAELSRRGRQHLLGILRLLGSLGVDRVFASPVAHCVAIGEAIAKDRGLLLELEPRLHDQHLGAWQGRDWGELRAADEARVQAFFRDYGAVAPPGGETLSAAVDRALAWWSELVDDLEGKTVLVVGGAPLLSGLAARLLGLSIGRSPAISLPPGAVGILDVYRDGAVLRSWHPQCLSADVP